MSCSQSTDSCLYNGFIGPMKSISLRLIRVVWQWSRIEGRVKSSRGKLASCRRRSIRTGRRRSSTRSKSSRERSWSIGRRDWVITVKDMGRTLMTWDKRRRTVGISVLRTRIISSWRRIIIGAGGQRIVVKASISIHCIRCLSRSHDFG